MDYTEKRKASFYDLPPEILESIAMNLYLPDYLHFRALCCKTWSLFGCSVPILKNIQALENNTSEVRCEDCHYISRGHILSYAYRKNGLIPKIDDLVQSGASLKHIPRGDMIERAARSPNYKVLLNWLIDHGASFQDVQGGIDSHRERSRQACRSHLLALKRALKEGATPNGSHEAMTATLKLRRRNGLNNAWRRPIT